MKRPNSKVQLADEGLGLSNDPSTISFYVLPKDQKNGVAKEIQVLNSERIIGYSTAAGMIQHDKDGLSDHDHSLLMTNDDSDYYNVTVNLIVKKGGAAPDFAAARSLVSAPPCCLLSISAAAGLPSPAAAGAPPGVSSAAFSGVPLTAISGGSGQTWGTLFRMTNVEVAWFERTIICTPC